ncbi:MAG: hypothetical protein IOD05_03205 [Rhodobacter sp.]|nr:hypothetical protein [Rhodobacter sp.]MCA3492307.1 hypothetical protein [Rhodobacter sp.]MCA3500892.1 hypothetical protein [Rhodobacter sp.]MCA3502270.1 hypothetical protein [Rhodobacter sp.]MCA3516311.1 hypothetical protein [Rhodobacter sp.]
MSKSDAFESALLALIFQNTNIANVGDATGLRGAAAAGQLFVALHTADPGEAGTQTTNEVAYTGYARVGLARSSGGFTITGNSVSPAANVNFPACTAGSATATHFSIGVASTGAGVVLYKGAISPAIAIAAGVTPQLTTATVITED